MGASCSRVPGPLVVVHRTLVGLALMLALTGSATAATLSFSGDLRADANIIGCGTGCTLDLGVGGDDDGTIAQWAGRVESFTLAGPSTGYAITFSSGGGVNGQGTAIAAGGFAPYLSLFNAAGAFLGSTYFAALIPPAYDVQLDFGPLSAGTYQIVISAWENMSFAENLGTGALADGLVGLGNLFQGEDLHYAFDVVLQDATVPEPATILLLLGGLGAAWARRRS